MFRNLRQKNFELEKKVKNKFFLAALVSVLPIYTFISPNLHIILKKKLQLHTKLDLKEALYF